MLRKLFTPARDDRGAVLILTAMTIPVVVAFGAFALGLTTLWTSRQDVQRSTDLAALAAAANTPTASVDFPLFGTSAVCPPDLTDPDPSDWRERPFYVVGNQLAGGRSAVSTAFSDGHPRVCAEWSYESPLLGAIGACVANIAELDGCRQGLEEELRRSLPVIDDLEASARSAIDTVYGELDPADKLVDAALATKLGDACANEVGTTLLGITTYVCTHRVKDLLDSIDHKTGQLLVTGDTVLAGLVTKLQVAAQKRLLDPTTAIGMGFASRAVPQMGFDLAGAAPAVVTPRVDVVLDRLDLRPSLSPFTFEMQSSSTARRQIKSALVLPTAGIPGVEAWAQLDAETQVRLTQKLGVNAGVALDVAFQTGGWVVDPQLHTHRAKVFGDWVLDEVDETEAALSASVNDSVCSALPATVSCPVGDDIVNRQHLLGPFMEDVRDASQPPPSQAPTVLEVLDQYADSDQVVWIVSGLRTVMAQVLTGDNVWQTLKNVRGDYTTLTNPPTNVSSLISPLMFVPALDVIPATVARDGNLYRINRATPERVAATTGLYKARLVQ